MHISSSYAKILGETNFRTREIPLSGSKAKDGEKKRKREKEERLNGGDNNGQGTHGALKHAWRTHAVCANLLVMPKHWGENYFAHGRFLEVGQKQKTERKKRGEKD